MLLQHLKNYTDALTMIRQLQSADYGIVFGGVLLSDKPDIFTISS